MNKKGSADMFKNTLYALVFFALFSTLILTFASDFLTEQGITDERIGGVGALDLNQFEASINGTGKTAETYRQSFEEGKVDDVDDATGIFSIATNFITTIVLPFTLLSQVMSNILGVPAFFSGVILWGLSLTLILGAWRLVRSGD